MLLACTYELALDGLILFGRVDRVVEKKKKKRKKKGKPASRASAAMNMSHAESRHQPVLSDSARCLKNKYYLKNLRLFSCADKLDVVDKTTLRVHEGTTSRGRILDILRDKA